MRCQHKGCGLRAVYLVSTWSKPEPGVAYCIKHTRPLWPDIRNLIRPIAGVTVNNGNPGGGSH